MASITTIVSTDTEKSARAGLAAGLSVYILWGFLPLLFKAVSHVPSMTVVANRTIWSLVIAAIILMAMRRLGEVRAAMVERRTLLSLGLAAALLAANWLIYVYAVETAQVLDASFGYFITPLVNVAFGLVLLGERLNRMQAIAIGIAVVAISLQAVGLAGMPLIALGIALTFASYGYIRKTARVSSAGGLFVETLLIAPVALGYLAYTFIRDGGVGPHGDPGTFALLLLLGPATAGPLLLFTFAVQRLRLTTIGMLQYIAPSIAFILAITVFGEHLNLLRLVSFALIWASLAVYTADSLMRRRAVAQEPA